MLPMAVALVMIATNPFWVIIIALCMFKEKIRPFEIIGIIVCLGGVAMLVYSEHFTALEEYEELEDKGEVTEAEYEHEMHIYDGMIVALIAAWTFALYNTYNFRKLKDRDHIQLIFIEACFGFVVFSLIIIVEFIFFGENEFRIYSGQNYGYILGACVLDTVAFHFQTAAFQYDSTRFVSLFNFNLVIYGFITDIFILIEPLNHFDVLGSITIHLAVIIVTVYKLCRKHRMNKQIALKE